ncbi:MAG: HAD family hydrolase [Bacteroidota bacterium]
MGTPLPDFLSRLDHSWSLFLDRDGVINHKREDDYVKRWEEFIFEPNCLEALRELSSIFERIVVVTNQRGIDKGLMSEADLAMIHQRMQLKIAASGGRIDQIYHCPHHPHNDLRGWRKPKIGMALQAQQDFPKIQFSHSVMIGDSWSDMKFGRNAGMKNVWISTATPPDSHMIDLQLSSLWAFAELCK